MIDHPNVGDVLACGSRTLNGDPNVCRVVRTDCAPSAGFYAVFVNPRDTRELRRSTDRPFFVWLDSPEHRRMAPYTGAPELVRDPAGQLTL